MIFLYFALTMLFWISFHKNHNYTCLVIFMGLWLVFLTTGLCANRYPHLSRNVFCLLYEIPPYMSYIFFRAVWEGVTIVADLPPHKWVRTRRPDGSDEKWAMQYLVAKVNNNPHAFHCIPCEKTPPCDHQGFADVINRCNSRMHTRIT